MMGYLAGTLLTFGVMLYHWHKDKQAWKDVAQRSLNAYKVYQDE